MELLITGQYPRSEQLIAATRDLDRGRIPLETVKEACDQDFQDFVALQKSLLFPSPGYFHWPDLLRPYAELLTSIEPGVLTRFFETNTFWRILQGKGRPRINLEPLELWAQTYFFAGGALKPDAPLVLTLPFLFLFKEYASGIPIELISDLLGGVAKHLTSFPNKILCFYEPTLGWRPLTKEEKKAGNHLLTRLKGQTPLFLNTFFFPLEKENHFLFNLPVDGIGIDFYNNSLAILKDFPQDKALLAGIINCDSTRMEDKGAIQKLIATLQTHLSEDKIYLGPNGPCELLPRTVMDAKVKQLQELL